MQEAHTAFLDSGVRALYEALMQVAQKTNINEIEG